MSTIRVISVWAVPFLVFFIPIYAYFRGVRVYEVFLDGAKEGFQTAIRLIPALVGMLTVIGIFRASGALDSLSRVLAPLLNPLGIPAEILPLALLRPLSAGGALGYAANIINIHGPDSYLGYLASVVQGSMETTFYVITVYFGAVGVSRVRHSIWAGLAGDLAGFIAALVFAGRMFS
ncbi:MAG: spore maturation protein [Bacillota bacterium]